LEAGYGAGTSWRITRKLHTGQIGAGIRENLGTVVTRHHRTDPQKRVGLVLGKKSLPTAAGSFFSYWPNRFLCAHPTIDAIFAHF